MYGQPPLQNVIDFHNTDNFFMENYLNSRLYSWEDTKENINGLIIAPPSVTPVPDNKNCPEICPGQLMEMSLVQWKKIKKDDEWKLNWTVRIVELCVETPC